MSRPGTQRPVQVDTFPVMLGTETLEAWFLEDGCDGVDAREPAWKLPRSFLRVGTDVMLTTNKRLRNRVGYVTGSNVTDEIVGLYGMRSSASTYVYILTTAGIKRGSLVGTTVSGITTLTGTALSGLAPGDPYCFLPWNETTLLLTTAATGLIAIDIAANTYSTVTDALLGASHVTAMNGRVVLSGFLTNPTRVQWSAKFDHTEWLDTALGAGYEDLALNDTGSQNAVYSIWPMSDTLGLVVRQNSIDIISTSTNFDVPFYFQQRHKLLQIPHRGTVARTKDSIIVGVYRDVLEVTPESVVSIGKPPKFTAQTVLASLSFATYSPYQDTYFISGMDEAYIWCYNRTFRAWTRWSAPAVNTKVMAYIGGMGSSAYNALSSTYNSQSGTLGTLGSLPESHEALCFGAGAVLYTTYTDSSSSGTTSFLFELPDLEPRSTSQLITVLTVEVGYYSTSGNANVYTVSCYDGVSTTTYGTFTSDTGTTALQRVILTKTTSGRVMRFRIAPGSPNSGDPITFAYIKVRYTEGAQETDT